MRGFLALFVTAFSPSAQGIRDLLEDRREAPYEAEFRVGRGRVDLALTPAVRFPERGGRRSLGVSARADLRMVCGLYDLKASFQHLLGKEAREEFLEGLPELLAGELVGSAMDLLCQAEPTLCALLQNYSIAANLKLGYYKDLCQAVEGAILDSSRRSYAQGIGECLREKEARGYPLDRAIEECQRRAPALRGFRGEAVGELDLGAALRGLLGEMGLGAGAGELAGCLAEGARLGPEGVSSEPDPHVVIDLFARLEKDYAARLENLVGKAGRREALSEEELRGAVPEGAPPLGEDEVRGLSLLLPRERRAVLDALSSSLALFELTRRLHEVERGLEALKGAPTVDEGKRALLEDRLARLRAERRRLEERYRDKALVMEALSGARALWAREERERVAGFRSRAGLVERKAALSAGLAPWGALPAGAPKSASKHVRGDRGFCGGLEYGFGSLERSR